MNGMTGVSMERRAASTRVRRSPQGLSGVRRPLVARRWGASSHQGVRPTRERKQSCSQNRHHKSEQTGIAPRLSTLLGSDLSEFYRNFRIEMTVNSTIRAYPSQAIWSVLARRIHQVWRSGQFVCHTLAPVEPRPPRSPAAVRTAAAESRQTRLAIVVRVFQTRGGKPGPFTRHRSRRSWGKHGARQTARFLASSGVPEALGPDSLRTATSLCSLA